MTHTILDILTSTADLSGTEDNSGEQEKNSICQHLRRLLNSRCDSLTHRPDFGMPDIAELYLGMPYSSEALMMTMRYAVAQFEPRLQQPQVREFDITPRQGQIHYELSGTASNGQAMRFIVSCCRSGCIEIRTREEYFSHVHLL